MQFTKLSLFTEFCLLCLGDFYLLTVVQARCQYLYAILHLFGLISDIESLALTLVDLAVSPSESVLVYSHT
jgi:hypothetical protein